MIADRDIRFVSSFFACCSLVHGFGRGKWFEARRRRVNALMYDPAGVKSALGRRYGVREMCDTPENGSRS